MSESVSETQPINIKTIEVEPVDEGVRVKPKKQLTETQLANLKKGREKLAEKRKAEKEQKEKESESGSVAISESGSEPDSKPESDTQTDSDSDSEELPYISCSIM
jgi:hypothetical protein